ncbi:hypothetical protein DPMN_117387 [Dreissena polymorpha]|uniref:Uncharacterized protein n=1 Tax=Dreissena polymorpha TaxID=45954 RepID=A0A9D4QVM3_DREPO|nr:hypothetical protein DPMN_117387 [Dreissena polymorpha]
MYRIGRLTLSTSPQVGISHKVILEGEGLDLAPEHMILPAKGHIGNEELVSHGRLDLSCVT